MLTSAEGHIPNLRLDLADRPYIPDTRRGQSNCSSSRTLPFREASSRSRSGVTEKSAVLVVNLARIVVALTAEEWKRSPLDDSARFGFGMVFYYSRPISPGRVNARPYL